MEIYFTKHAKEKFSVLLRHDVKITRKKVVETVEFPEYVDHSRAPLIVAQSTLDNEYVVRVVYKVEEDVIIIITFYPGRKIQYEKE